MKSIRDYLDIFEANMPMGRQVARTSPTGGDSGLAGAIASTGTAGGAGAALKKSVQTLAPAAKIIPGAMSAMSVYDALDRYKEGDTSGAVISVLAAAGYLVPGPMGWTLGGAADTVNFGRDIGNGKYDRAVQAVKDFVNEEKNTMNNAEHIAALRQKLSKIEEGLGSTIVRRTAGQLDHAAQPRVVKDMGKLDAIEVPPRQLSGPSSEIPGQASAAASKGSRVGKTAGAATLVGAAGTAGYLSTQGGGAGSTGTTTAGGKPSGIATNTPAAGAGGLSPEEEQELFMLADKLGKHMGRNPDVDKLLLRHTKLRGNQPTPPL